MHKFVCVCAFVIEEMNLEKYAYTQKKQCVYLGRICFITQVYFQLVSETHNYKIMIIYFIIIIIKSKVTKVLEYHESGKKFLRMVRKY